MENDKTPFVAIIGGLWTLNDDVKVSAEKAAREMGAAFANAGLGGAPNPEIYPFLMFAGLVAAGATGALVRSVTWNPDETAPGRSVVLGGIAGFVVGAAYLIPQFIGAPDVLASKPTEVVWKAKVQFVSAVLVAISAGVGFDTVFARLRKDAEQQPIGVSVSSQVQKWKW
jgi:hypothetical protein